MSDWFSRIGAEIGEAVSRSLGSAWENVPDSVWDVFLRWLYSAVYGAVSDFFAVISGMGAGIFELAWVRAAVRLFGMFGMALYAAGLAVAVFDTAIEYQSMGRLSVKRQVMPAVWGLLAAGLFTRAPVELYRYSVQLQNTFSRELAELFAGQGTEAYGVPQAASAALRLIGAAPGALSLIFVIALAFCVARVFFANIKRGGILLTQIAVGSLYMFGLPAGYTDGFMQWCRQVIALCLTAFMQTSLLFLGLLTWQTDMLMGLGVMLAAGEVPQIARQFGLDTSVRVNMASAVRTTTSAVKLTRIIAGR